MVSKKNLQQQNGSKMRQTRQGGAAAAAAPYKKPFKPPGNNFNQQIMFNTSQIPDKGYMDFNNPTPSISGPPAAAAAANGSPQVPAQQKKKNNKNKQKNKQPQQQQQQQLQPNGAAGNWNKNRNPPPHQRGPNTRFNGGMPPQRGFNPMGNMGPIRGRRMMPPGPMPPHGFQAPMIPPIPHMRRGPMPPPPMGIQPPPFLRRSGRGGPMPPPIPPMMPPHMVRGVPPVPFIGAGGKMKKPNNKLIKKVVKGKSSIKTLKNLVNQYPVDKPWVTAEIRAEHDKKVDIENRLKGNKDDDLFAQFKTQRDIFVAMYEAARDEHLKKEAAAVKAAKDAKDKQTINKTAAKDGNNKEAIAKNNANAKA